MGLQFHDVDFEIIDQDGNRWVTVKQLARALEYGRPDELLRLIQRNATEFNGKTLTVNLTGKRGRPETVISYHGVIRVAMLSDAPRAIEFRDFAESVLYPVMTQGYYLPAEAETALVQKLTGMIEQKVDGRLCTLDDKLSALTSLVTARMITAEPDITEWPTPAQRIGQLIAPVSLPPYFNRGGHFNWWVSEEHFKEYGGFLRQRSRRGIQKMPEYVVQPCPENDMFLRNVFKKYLKAFWPPAQGNLFQGFGRRVKRQRRSRRIRRFTR